MSVSKKAPRSDGKRSTQPCVDHRGFPYIDQYKAKYSVPQRPPSTQWNAPPSRVALSADLIKNGVPDTHRRFVWFQRSGALDMQKANAGVYDQLCTELDADSARLAHLDGPLSKDIPRTHPANPRISTPEMLGKVERIIRAYALRNPIYNYTAGTNLPLAIMLLFLEEEEAFWLFVVWIERIMPSQFFVPPMLDVRADLGHVLPALIDEKVPSVGAMLRQHNLTPIMFATSWTMVMFSSTEMPSDTLLRVWDLVFGLNEGYLTILRFSVAMLKLFETELLQHTSFNDFMMFLSSIPARCFDADRLVRVAYADVGRFSVKRILDMRAATKPALMKEAYDHAQLMRSLNSSSSSSSSSSHGSAVERADDAAQSVGSAASSPRARNVSREKEADDFEESTSTRQMKAE